MTVSLEEVKKFIRVDGTFEDDVIHSLISAAITELRLSGVSERTTAHEDYPLYELAVKAIVSQNYEGRGVIDDNKSIINSLVLKLKDYPAVSSNE
ncbi:head-tail connector protein [Oceanobacillus caeni]